MKNYKQKNIPFYCDEKEFVKFVDRVTQGKYGKFIRFVKKESESGFDEYRLRCKDGIIEICATSGTAGGSALNAYLKKYCSYYVGFLTRAGELPNLPPETKEDLVEQSIFHYRYAFNYCTFGYSYAFNTWEDWERITDYLILSGYNLVLNQLGNECVWLELLQKFGYTREEAKKYISAPNYLPWQWMMNLSAFQSEYPDYWFDEQKEISRKFNAKLKAFGMSALMPGYCGAVPDDFKDKHPDAQILDQGLWCESFVRPAILLPKNELFIDIATTYYRLQKELLGAEDMHYYSTDPFHEGGEKGDVDMNEYANRVLSCMRSVDENAVWALQGWNGNPDRRILSALNKEDVLIMNLHADQSFNGGDDFLGYPHIYCVVNNFGGEQAMRGSALKTYSLPFELAKSRDSACCGIGIIPEGVECDEVLFDIVSEVSVKSNLLPVKNFLGEYIKARYGFVNDDLISIYQELFDKVYTEDIVGYQHESGLIACPSLEVDRVCFWAGHSLLQDNTYLLDIVKSLFFYYENCKSSEGYRKDLLAVLRQYIANESWRYIYGLQDAVKNKDLVEFEKNEKGLMQLFDLQEQIVDCDKDLNLQNYLNKAKLRGRTEKDKKWLVRSAKLLITFWTESKNGYGLHDYAAREYGDMLRYFYRPRWEKFIQAARVGIKNNEKVENYDRYNNDKAFLEDDKNYTLRVNDNFFEIVQMVLSSLEC